MHRHRFALVTSVLVLLVVLGVWLGLKATSDHDPARGHTAMSSTPSDTTSAALSQSSSADQSEPSLLPPPGSNGKVTLPDTTDLTTLGPGPHNVTIRASSDRPMLVVAYSVKDGRTRGQVMNVKSPLTISRTVSGGRPYAAVTVQLASNATIGTCSIAIDGTVVDTHSATQPYVVIGCVG